MKREQKQNLLLAFLTAFLLSAVYILMPSKGVERMEGGENLTIYSMEEGAVSGLSFDGAEGRISLIKKNDGWIWENDAAFPLNQKFVDTMLSKTTGLKARRYVAEGREHFPEYGLENPSNTILVTGEDGIKSIYLGSTNSATGDCYMTVEGEEKIYTVDASFSRLFSGSINAMAARETLPGISPDNMTGMTAAVKGREVSFFRERAAEPGRDESDLTEGGGWSVQETGAAAMDADDGLVSECLGQLVKLRYKEMAVYNPSDMQMEEYGLTEGDPDNTGMLHVFYGNGERATGLEYILHIGTESPDGLDYYVYPEGGQGIYTVQKEVLDPFLRLVPEDFLSLSVAPVKAETLAGLRIIWAEGEAEFAIIRPENGAKPVYTLNGDEITEADFNRFYYPLYAFAAEKRVADMAGQLTRKPVLTLLYERTEDAGAELRVELIPYDQNYYGAKVNGQAFLLVNRQRVGSLLDVVERLPVS